MKIVSIKKSMINKFSRIYFDIAVRMLVVSVLFSAACGQSNTNHKKAQEDNTSSEASPVASNDVENARLIKEIQKAIAGKDYEQLAELLKLKPNLNVRSESEDSLLVTTMYDDVKAAETLIAAGADPNFKSSIVGCAETERCLKSPTYIAFKDGNLPALEVLLKGGADPNSESILAWAVSRGNEKAIKIMITYKADINYNKDIGKDGQTPLFFANEPKIAEILIKSGADIKHTDDEGETLLMFAVREDNLKMGRFFIKIGVPVNAKNKSGETALQIAKAQGNLKIINELKRFGAIK